MLWEDMGDAVRLAVAGTSHLLASEHREMWHFWKLIHHVLIKEDTHYKHVNNQCNYILNKA